MKDYENTINSIQDLINSYRLELEKNKKDIIIYKQTGNEYMITILETENNLYEKIIKRLETL